MPASIGPFSLERVVSVVEKVRQRGLRTSSSLNAAGISYAITGDNAVALWDSRVDEAAVRNTQDVDVLIRREDLAAATAALEIDVGLINADWLAKLPKILADRLRQLLDTPQG